MDLASFSASLNLNEPPAGFSPELKSLWYDANGDWHKSHEIAQDIAGRNGSWIHAYLHRKEGDQWNADYWYAKAGRTSSTLSIDEELNELVQYFSDTNHK